MNKWGVRLIGCLFILWAILNALGIDNSKGSSYDISLPFYGNAGQINIVGWIGVCILAYGGYNLLRFNSMGRIIALIVLWPLLILSGIYSIIRLFSSISAFVSGTYSIRTYHFFHTNWPGEISSPLLQFLIPVVEFLLFFVSINFTMRKDVKQLFEKPVTTGETN